MEQTDDTRVILNDESNQQGEKRTKSFINRSMIPLKLSYFFYGCSLGTYGIYFNPFFISLGISKSNAGFITGIAFAIATIAGPLWGILSDYTGRRTLIILIMCFAAAGSIASLPLVANTFVNPTNNVKVCKNLNITSPIFCMILTHAHLTTARFHRP